MNLDLEHHGPRLLEWLHNQPGHDHQYSDITEFISGEGLPEECGRSRRGHSAMSDRTTGPLPAVVLAPGAGEKLDYRDGDVSIILVSGQATGGAFTIAEHRLGPRAPGPPLHYHHRLCDSFYVLEGVLTLRCGERAVQAPPGTFACFPRE